MIQRFSPSLTFVLLFLILYSSTSSHFLVFPFLSYTVDLSLADCRNGRDADFHSCFFLPHNTKNLVFEANVSQYCHPSDQQQNSFLDIKSIVLHVTLNLHVSTVLCLIQQDST